MRGHDQAGAHGDPRPERGEAALDGAVDGDTLVVGVRRGGTEAGEVLQGRRDPPGLLRAHGRPHVRRDARRIAGVRPAGHDRVRADGDVGDRRQVHVDTGGSQVPGRRRRRSAGGGRVGEVGLRGLGRRPAEDPDLPTLLVGADQRPAAGRALQLGRQRARARRVGRVVAEEDHAGHPAGAQRPLHVRRGGGALEAEHQDLAHEPVDRQAGDRRGDGVATVVGTRTGRPAARARGALPGATTPGLCAEHDAHDRGEHRRDGQRGQAPARRGVGGEPHRSDRSAGETIRL